MPIIVFTYKPNQHIIAHILEHCLSNLLNSSFANTGSGYSAISADKKIDLMSLKNKISKDIFIKNKGLVLSEEYDKIFHCDFLSSSFIEYGVSSVSELRSMIKKSSELNFTEFKKIIDKNFDLKFIRSKNDIKKIIPPESITMPLKFSSTIKSNSNFSVYETGWLLPINDICEAIVADLIIRKSFSIVGQELYQKGIAYRSRNIIYKPAGNHFFANFSHVSKTFPQISFKSILSKVDLKSVRKEINEIVSNYQKEEAPLLDAVMQKMDWGVFMENEEIAKKLKSMTSSKLENILDKMKIMKYRINALQ